MRTVSLGDVIDVDRAIASEDDCRTLPYVGLEHIEKESGRFSDDFRPKPEEVLATKFRFTPEHVLYGKLRPYLNKVALPYFRGVCTTEILPLLPKARKLERAFLYAILLAPRFVSWASQNVSGANLPRLGPDRLLDYQFELPDLAEQKRIAAILERADRLRRLRRYGLEMAETLLSGAFRDLFGQNQDWERCTLDDLATDFCYGTSTKCGAEKSLSPVLRIPNVIGDAIDIDDLKYGALTDSEKTKLRLDKDDLLFVRTNGNPDYVGRCALFDLDGEFYFASYLIRARLRESEISPLFLASFLRTPLGRKSLGPSIRTTAGQYNVSIEGLRNVVVVKPPKTLQERFAAFIQHHDHVRRVHRESLRQAEHVFQTLLHRAFTSGL